MLRPYQQDAFESVITWIKKCVDPCLVEAATGAGKSHVVAAIAEWLNNKSGKKVLCLAPSKELVGQNHGKYLKTGNPASIYCASINKSLAHDVVFGSPQTVKNSLHKFGDNFSAIVIDEAHGITPTVIEIIKHMKRNNPRCRIIGLTATPYRPGSGYIYQYDVDGNPMPEEKARDPFFNTLVYSIKADELIGMGFLTPPIMEPTAEHYDTSSLELNRMGQFDAHEVERVFEGHGRKTAKIVHDVVENSYGRNGVLIFAATVPHAKECMASLDPDNARIVTSQTKAREREKIIDDFQNRKFKYLVNVSVLTTGFDATHVDVIAILRATESVGLLQQIIGRGLRLDECKSNCLILDYAENLDRHCPDGDIFNPKIEAKMKQREGVEIDAVCPECGMHNKFAARKNPDQFEWDEEGYFVDLEGNRIVTEDGIAIPAHYGRRCFGQQVVNGFSQRCEHRWSSKECHECGHHNDIAARYCKECRAELVDPNEKLRLEFKKMKRDPYTPSTDKVLSWRVQSWQSQAGNQSLRVDWTTEYRTFPAWYSPVAHSANKQALWLDLCKAALPGKVVSSIDDFVKMTENFEAVMPKTITSYKNRSSGFFTVIGHNKEEDKKPQ